MLRVAHTRGWYDHFNDRKIHTESTPRLGGVGIFVAFVLASLTGLLVVGPGQGLAPWSIPTLLLILAGLFVIHGLGLYDDFVNLRAPLKFTIQLAAAGLVAGSGVTIRLIDLPWLGTLSLPPVLAVALTVLWVVSISNAVNLIDGADGMAGGVALLAALFMAIIALAQGSLVAALPAAALVGALAGFLVYNLPPARIFMGDSGSLTLGFILAVIPLLGLERGSAAGVPFAPLPVLTLLYIPITDTLLAITRRLKRGLPVHAADREHLHHRLMDRGFYARRLLAIVYTGMLVLGLSALGWYALPATLAGPIILGVWAIALVLIMALGRKRSAGG
mgnify:CR=1 FL=1